MRPYFETKVVKVRKEKKCNHLNVPCIHDYIYNGKIRCPQCGKILTSEWLEKRKILDPLLVKGDKKKGDWVNGENLDKIKFPVPCSYIDCGEKHIGMLNCYVNWYRLYHIGNQSKDNFVDDCTSLGNLIRDYDIHILKGKIIVFEEEEK